MISLLSIHIPKTAGTSFYQVLADVYQQRLSPSLRRKDIPAWMEQNEVNGNFTHPVWHGHIRYSEAAPFCDPSQTKMITWLRHPIERVYSNYLFFQSRLQDPSINPEVYALNQHRLGESILDYASFPENQNRMSWFLQGSRVDQYFFVGITERFSADLQRLSALLRWQNAPISPHLNQGPIPKLPLSPHTIALLEKWNEWDLEWYYLAKSYFAS